MNNTTQLKVEIARRGLLIKQVSERSGVNINYVSMACNGRIRLKSEHEKAIAAAINAPLRSSFRE